MAPICDHNCIMAYQAIALHSRLSMGLIGYMGASYKHGIHAGRFHRFVRARQPYPFVYMCALHWLENCAMIYSIRVLHVINLECTLSFINTSMSWSMLTGGQRHCCPAVQVRC